MKMKYVPVVALILLALQISNFNLTAQSAKPLPADVAALINAGEVQSFRQQLLSVPAAELPNKVAQIISNAPVDKKKAVTASVVKAALAVSPSSAAAIIAAIARTNPDVVVIAVQVATAEQPSQSEAIAAALAAARQSFVLTAKTPTANTQTAIQSINEALAAIPGGDEILAASSEVRNNYSSP